MNLWKKIINRIKGIDQKGNLSPRRLDNAKFLSPQKEAVLRALVFDCNNLKLMFDHIDLLEAELKKADYQRWKKIMKGQKK